MLHSRAYGTPCEKSSLVPTLLSYKSLLYKLVYNRAKMTGFFIFHILYYSERT